MPVVQNANTTYRWTHTCGAKSYAFQSRAECNREYKKHVKRCAHPDDTL